MLKLYLQIFLVLINSLGILLSFVWLILTFLYYNHGIENGQSVSIDYFQVSMGIVVMVASSLGVFFSTKWYNRNRAHAAERMKKYRELSDS